MAVRKTIGSGYAGTILAGFLVILFGVNAFASENSLKEDVKAALESGSAKELVRLFTGKVEITMSGSKAGYSQSEAENLFRGFFGKHPATGFDYVHEGSSQEGLKYAIGKYKSSGATYRVYILMSQESGQYLVRAMNFTEE
ncbi:hypothetical protein FUAX_01380 [Fulvitalea axinellae]|uniref:DUF4783 domain-containing protein n=1 Tax=Fulvitalea axinellae TaxID=1182444 RepID=A0AAU9D4G9_9BACT|nr:hypothetical protein FUAX_01380 [Fulvitalea axinellae]